jgi:spore germination protein YaaH
MDWVPDFLPLPTTKFVIAVCLDGYIRTTKQQVTKTVAYNNSKQGSIDIFC